MLAALRRGALRRERILCGAGTPHDAAHAIARIGVAQINTEGIANLTRRIQVPTLRVGGSHRRDGLLPRSQRLVADIVVLTAHRHRESVLLQQLNELVHVVRDLAAALALSSAHARLRFKGITVRGNTARNANDLLIGVRELHLVTVEGVHGAARTRNGLAVIGLIQDARNVLARQAQRLELALSLEGELVTAGRGLERAQGQNLHGEGVRHRPGSPDPRGCRG